MLIGLPQCGQWGTSSDGIFVLSGVDFGVLKEPSGMI